MLKLRNTYIDNIKGIMIFFVVLGHLISAIILKEENHLLVYDAIVLWIYFFHMPMFIFISGYLSKNLVSCRNNAFINTYIPFLAVNIILCLVYHMKVNPFIYPAGAAWYLLTLFFYRLLIEDLIKIRHIGILSMILVGLVTYFGKNPTFGNFCVFLPFYLCGVKSQEIQIYEKKNNVYKQAAYCCLIISFILVFIIFEKSEIQYFSPFYLSYAEIGCSVFYKQLFVYIIAIMFIILWLFVVDEKPHFYTKWGKYSITIYIFHAITLPYIKNISDYFDIQLQGLVTVIISFIICFIFGNAYI